MFNQVTLIGNVGRDPEIRSMNNGGRVASFSIATSERWKDKQTGQRKESTEWHKVTVFNEGLVGVIENYVAKGSKLMIQGKMKTRMWEKDGVKHYTTEVVLGRYDGTLQMLDSAGSSGGGGPDESSYGTTRDRDVDGGRGFDAGRSGPGADEFSADLDDEIPF